MFTFLNRSTDYSLRSLLGFDVFKIPLTPFTFQDPSLTIISKLFTSGKPVLALSKEDRKLEDTAAHLQSIEKVAQNIENLLSEHDYHISISPVMIHSVDDGFIKAIAKDEFSCLKNQYVFLNAQHASTYKDVYELVFDLQAKNLKPVLSFPEKNLQNASKSQRFLKLRDRGCKSQIDLFSLSGLFGQDTKKAATSLLENKEVQFVSLQLQQLDFIEESKGLRISRKVANLLDEQLFIA